MDLLEQLAEARIRQAQSDGEFDNLAGAGLPLQPEPDELLDPSLRVAYRILKNSGFVPPEVAQRQQIGNIESLLQHISDPAKRKPLIAELFALLTQVDGSLTLCTGSRAQYYRQLLERLGDSKPVI